MGTYTLHLVGTGGGLSRSVPVSYAVTAAPSPGDFTLSGPQTGSVRAGQSISFVIRTEPVNGGISTPVTLTDIGWPTGFTGVFSPATVSVPGSSVLTVTTTGAAMSGYLLPVIGVAAGNRMQTTTLMITVTGTPPPANISLSAPMTLHVASGAQTAFTLSVAGNNGFSGTVGLTAVTPAGISMAIGNPAVNVSEGNPASVPVTITAGPSGTYALQIRATAAGVPDTSVAITLTVGTAMGNPDFMLSSVSPVTVETGTTKAFSLGVMPVGGFSGNVSFTASGAPAGSRRVSARIL